MLKHTGEITGETSLKVLAKTGIINTIIAVFLTTIGFGKGFAVNFIFSQCIGLSICLCVMTAYHLTFSTQPLE